MRLILISLLAVLTCRAAEPPNILFIFSDDHALQAISAYGGRYKDVAPTPNIDRLARQGVVFERSFCDNSICGPSRASVLTGSRNPSPCPSSSGGPAWSNPAPARKP